MVSYTRKINTSSRLALPAFVNEPHCLEHTHVQMPPPKLTEWTIRDVLLSQALAIVSGKLTLLQVLLTYSTTKPVSEYMYSVAIHDRGSVGNTHHSLSQCSYTVQIIKMPYQHTHYR